MPDRLSPLDVSFLYFEEDTTPMHVGGVAIFQVPDDGFDYDRLVQLIRDRIAFVPRYRQKVRWIPGHLANPVWVDDPHFDLSYHVRRSALPRPGTDEQLRELVGRLQSRRLDRRRPLWEMYLVEGLRDSRFAVVTKTHHAMVDGIAAVDIGTVMLDPSPHPRETPIDSWQPAPEPSWAELVVGAVADVVRRPTAVVDAVRGGLDDVQATTTRLVGTAGGLLAAARTALSPVPDSPLNTEIGEQRRFGMATANLDDYKRIRKAHGGMVNDVVLTTVTGALRSWLIARGEVMLPGSTVRAMVPVSIRGRERKGAPDRRNAMGNQISSLFVDLPIGEPDPVQRLRAVSAAMKEHKESGQAVGADALVRLSGFAPPTLHLLGARVASDLSRHLFNVMVTNVPGPQYPLYAAGARMLAAHPVVPLARRQSVAIACTSYDGKLCYGLNADRDAMPDVDVLAQCLVEALAELLATVR
ncbi:wax ester/triacylglycerol synthase family O-acyltransferase [soil metagenome]